MANGSVPDSLAAASVRGARRLTAAGALAASLLAGGCAEVDGVVQDIADAVFYDAGDDAPYRSLHEVPDEAPAVSSAEERTIVAAGLIAEREAARRKSAALRDPGAQGGGEDRAFERPPERRVPDEPRPGEDGPAADATADAMAAFRSRFDERFDASGGVLDAVREARPAPERTEATRPETSEIPAAEGDPAEVVLHLGTVHFAKGSARLQPGDRALVKEAARLQRESGARLRVVGHASRRTADMPPVHQKVLNLNLSLDRAGAVARALIAEGVPAGALSLEGAAASRPIADEDMPRNEAQNRRAEIFIEY